MDFPSFFEHTTGHGPRPYQSRLGCSTRCEDRLIRVPTGLGKTAAVATTWLFHRVHRGDLSWPTRLVWVLPMRTLVEQTLRTFEELRERSGLAFEVVPCMGGLVDKEYAVHPDRPTVMIGTQDMLISRKINRGYAAARGRWPVDFGLLSRDALVVCDEIQLMDASLPTTAQLAAFLDRRPAIRPSATWWMSATLQADWLRTVDFAERVDALSAQRIEVPSSEQHGSVWATQKRLSLAPDLSGEKDVARAVIRSHEPGTLTLVIVNRVDRAVAIHKLLQTSDADIRLVHSRFRPADREAWLDDFLSREAELPAAGRVVVATQVVEAGVDFSARRLFTDLAPWSSLVQRFGRAARYSDESADVVVMGAVPTDDKSAAPYSAGELVAAHAALLELVDQDSDVGLRSLETYEQNLDAERRRVLYPMPTNTVLRERDLLDLFDTTPDLSGADLDVAPFVRVLDARNVSVFWRSPSTVDDARVRFPRREELCSCPIAGARKWLDKIPKGQWWLLDYSRGWLPGSPSTLRTLAPGRVVRVHPDAGGYLAESGWSPRSKARVREVTTPSGPHEAFEQSAAMEGEESLSHMVAWRTVATHCAEAADEAGRLATNLALPVDLRHILDIAVRWHDVGKLHPVFQECITDSGREVLDHPRRQDLAKAPGSAWARSTRRGFRHELASALALLAVLRRADPDHEALRGGVLPVLDALNMDGTREPTDLADHSMASELLALPATSIDLILWLVATHHGKVRSNLVSTPNDQKDMQRMSTPTVQVHGVQDGEFLPEAEVAGPTGPVVIPALRLDLAVSQVGVDADFGRSWSERAARLLDRHGPFDLAYLEALVRAADVRASLRTTPDPSVNA